MDPIAISLLAAVIAIAVALLLVLRIFARRIVGLTHSSTPARIVDWQPAAGRVRLSRDRFTSTPGEYGLWWDDRHGHARIGRIVAEDARTVTREVIGPTGPSPRSRAETTGSVFAGPDGLGLPWTEVRIPTDVGDAPAWHFPGTTDAWVVHVHGIRTSRLSPLRGVPVFAERGYHSLVVSYRGDGEIGAGQGDSSALGLAEWPDVDRAIDHALAQGAERVLLMGWSMGGGMALLTAERARNRAAIDGLVLVAPATNWREVVLHGARQARIPEWLARAVLGALGSRRWSRILCGVAAIDFDALDWTSRDRGIAIPTLVIHSPDDDEVPFDLSHRLAERNATVQLAEIDGARHTLEWNRDRVAFDSAISTWVRATARTTR